MYIIKFIDHYFKAKYSLNIRLGKFIKITFSKMKYLFHLLHISGLKFPKT